MENVFGVIMAGGSGERFWPLSRKSQPKQCLKIFSKKSMMEETVERLAQLIPKNRIFIATNTKLGEKFQQVLKDVNFVLEPLPRNTAACIGLSAAKLETINPEAIMVIDTSDHIYQDVPAYLEHLKVAIEAAKKNNLVTIGIKPTRPETGFGYLELGEKESEKVFTVKKFIEKPDLDKAKELIASEKFLWNSGIFVFKAKRIMQALEKHMPKLFKGLREIQQSDFEEETVKEVFEKLKSVSIDYGVMEKEKEIKVVKGDFPWDDVGDWASLERFFEKNAEGNIVQGVNTSVNSSDNIIFSDKLVATLGVKDLIIVNTNDALLVCHKNQAQKLKELTKKLAQKQELKKCLE